MIYLLYNIWLVVYLPLWEIWVSWDDDIPKIWRNKTCSNHQPDIEVQKQHVDRIDISLCINQICLNDNIEKWEENEVWWKYATFIGSILNFTDKIQQTMVLMQQ